MIAAFISATVAFICFGPSTSAKDCPADIIRKFDYSLSNSFSSDGWWDMESKVADKVEDLRAKPVRQLTREVIKKSLICEDDAYTSQKFEKISFALELKYYGKCGTTMVAAFAKRPFNVTRTFSDVTVSSNGKEFRISGIAEEIDYLEECSLGFIKTDNEKTKRKDRNQKISSAFTTGLLNKFLALTRTSILYWGKCTSSAMDTYGAIFRDLAKTWSDVTKLADDKKAFEGVKTLRAKLDGPPNRESMIAAMYCDDKTKDFSRLQVLPEDNLAILFEADPKDGDKKCAAKLTAKTMPLRLSVKRSEENEIQVFINKPKFEAEKDEACRLPSGIAESGVKLMQDVLAEKITDLATACSADATQKMSTALNKMFQDGFKFAKGAGDATFDAGTTAASAVKFRCDIDGKLAGATSTKDLSVSLTLKLSTASCAAGTSTEKQTAQLKLTMQFDVGKHIQAIDVYNKAKPNAKTANCWSLGEQVRAGIPRNAFAERVRDAVIEAVYSTWNQCPSEILDALAVALEAEDYEKSSSSKSDSISGAKERRRRRRRQRWKRSSKAFKGFTGMKMSSYVIGCDKDAMPGAKITRFLAKESSTRFFANAEVNIRATCTETTPIPCSSADICNGGCYHPDVLSDSKYCDQRPYTCGTPPSKCRCCSAKGCHGNDHPGVYRWQKGPCQPKSSGGQATVESDVTATRVIGGKVELKFDYSQGKQPIGSSFNSNVQLSLDTSLRCQGNMRYEAREEINKAVKEHVNEVFAKFT